MADQLPVQVNGDNMANCSPADPEDHGGSMEDHAGSSYGGARPKQYSNVIVDDSPLQNQMEKNKECKSSMT